MKKTYATSTAFPFSREEEVGDYGHRVPKFQDGLTKREYFAAMAMQGLCSNPEYVQLGPTQIAEHAVTQADKLIEELNKATNP